MGERARDPWSLRFISIVTVLGLTTAVVWLRISVFLYRALDPPVPGESNAAVLVWAMLVLSPLLIAYFALEYWF